MIGVQIEERRNLEKEIFFLTDTIIENIIQLGNKELTENQEKFAECLRLMDDLLEKLANYLSGKQEYLEELLRQLFSQKLPDQRVLTSFQSFSNNLESIITEALIRYKKHKLAEEKTELSDEAATDVEQKLAEQESLQANNLMEENNVNPKQDEMAMDPGKETEESENGIRELEKNIKSEKHGDNLDSSLENFSEVSLVKEVKVSEKGESIDLEKLLCQFFKGKKLIKNYKIHGIELPYFFPDLNLAVELSSTKQPKKEVWKEYYCSKANITLITISQKELNYYRRISKHLRRYLSSVGINNRVEDDNMGDAHVST